MKLTHKDVLAGTATAVRYVHTLPSDTFADRKARADALQRAMRVMKLGDWRPTFPYN